MSKASRIAFQVCALPILLLIQSVYSYNLFSQKIEKGHLNLSGNSFKSDYYELNGEWEFYPDLLLQPKDFDTLSIKPEYISVPGLWHQQENQNIKSARYGTYRLNILLPEESIYSLNINRIQSSYKLWINDKFITQQGQVSDTKDSSEPFWSARNLTFVSQYGDNEIVIQVSNYHHKKSGIEQRIMVGSPTVISKHTWFSLGTDIFLIGVLLIMGVYHLGLFLSRKRDYSSLFYALTMFASAAFSGTVGEIIYTKVWLDFNWFLLVKLNYVSNYLRLLFFVLFIYSVFADKRLHKVILLFTAFAIAMVLFSAIAPTTVVTHTLIVFLMFTVLSVIFVLWLLIRAVIKKSEGVILSFIGTLLLTLTAVNDILNELKIISTVSLVTFGMFLFTLVQAYLLALRNAYFNNNLEQMQSRLVMLAEIKDGLLGTTSNKLENLMNVIGDVMKMTHGILLLRHGEKWQVAAEYSLGKAKAHNTPAFGMLDNIRYPKSILKEVIEKKSDFFLETRTNSNNAHTDYLIGYGVQNIYCLVTGPEGMPTSIIQFEDKNRDSNELEHKKKALQTIKPQISVFVENFDFYRQLRELNLNLEANVAKRTAEIYRQNEELEVAGAEIAKQNEFLEKAYQDFSLQNIEISDSVRYARKIQQSVLPQRSKIQAIFPDAFIFFKPEEQLSGDFYWVESVKHQNQTVHYLACADATGKGVTGALMSIVGNNMLMQTLFNDKLRHTDEILNSLTEKVGAILTQHERFEANDRIELALIAYYPETNTLEYSGSRIGLVIANRDNFSYIPPAKYALGDSFRKKVRQPYTRELIDLQPNDMLYIFTDGITNQLGGAHLRRFTKKRMFEMLKSIQNSELDLQMRKIGETVETWRGEMRQLDDMLVIGIRFNNK